MLKLINVNKIYGKDNNKVYALKDINLTIDDGEFIAIIGPSGSGKSTLLNILGCIDQPTDGEYLIDDSNANKLSNKKAAEFRNKQFGFVLQYFGLIKDYTVFQNVFLPLSYCKDKIDNKNERVNNILEELGLGDKKDCYPNELSGGQCQRVAIARALIVNPNVILADEPTGALDSANGEEILSILKKLNNNGKTVIIVSHDEKIYSHCNRILRITDGKLTQIKG